MDETPFFQPPALPEIMKDADLLGFAMSCEPRTGSLLSTLAASKPGGHMVELGTGVGAGTSWLLEGMDADSHLTSIDTQEGAQAVAARHLGYDRRLTLRLQDADAWLDTYSGPLLSLVYVDCRPGKFRRMGDVLNQMAPGGIYIVDDLLPQVTWPEGHQPRVDQFLKDAVDATNLRSTPMRWASGLMLGVRR